MFFQSSHLTLYSIFLETRQDEPLHPLNNDTCQVKILNQLVPYMRGCTVLWI